MLVYQRVYELSKCHCWILLIGYWLGGYFAWFIRDEFCCNLRRHSWDTYEPTNTMGWDRADRARTTGHDLAMKRNMSNPDWNRIPAGHERGATHYAACARSLKIEKKHGWTVDQWPLFIFVHLCSSLFNNCREQHSSYADPAVHRHSLVTSPSVSILRVSHAWEWPMEAATWSSWHVASYPWKFKCIKEMNGFLNMLDDIRKWYLNYTIFTLW